MTKNPLGKLRASAFGMIELPPIPAEILDGFRTLPDLTGMASDAMDELGIVGAVPAAMGDGPPDDPIGFRAMDAFHGAIFMA